MIASQKADYRFKVGWLGDKKPEEWIQVENVHEPLVDMDTYNLVQEKVKMLKRPDAWEKTIRKRKPAFRMGCACFKTL